MRINEGGNFIEFSEIEDYYRNKGFEKDGYCSYKTRYYICYIDFFNTHGSINHPLMKKLSRLASNSGLEFPQSFDSNAEFFLCTTRGTPYDGSKNYNRCYFNTIEEVIDAMKGKLNESLKEKIRTALKEDSVARKTTRWNPDTQPNIYQLDIFLRKSGYRLVDVVNNGGHPEPIIESIKEGHLHPDITYSVSDQVFYVEVKKYGELVASDLEEVIKGYQTALGVVQHLEDLDLYKLEFRESESE